MSKSRIVVLGAGISGLSIGYHLHELGYSSAIYEQEPDYGGLCGSFSVQGFTFDNFAHISFDNHAIPFSLLEDSTPYYVHAPEALNYAHSFWLGHPAQKHLASLPLEERIDIIKDFVHKPDLTPHNYGEWLRRAYGNYFAEHYPYVYTRKYWTVEPEQLETAWVQGRMSELTLDEILRGAMTNDISSSHYAKEARYPKQGGFKAFLRKLATGQAVYTGYCVCRIDTQNKRIYFRNGAQVDYDVLFSTLPLTELCSMLDSVPLEIQKAVDKLDYTSGAIVSIGLKVPEVSPALWFYIYDEDILPARVHSPGRQSPANVPEGCSSLQAEIYFSKYKPLSSSLECLRDRAVEGLLKLGLFKSQDIIFTDIRVKKYANIMFTPTIYTARDMVHRYLDQLGIYYAGRFGQWDYLWVGQCVIDGQRVAKLFATREGHNYDNQG